MRDPARKVLGVSSKQRKEDKETWWWDEEVQESILNNILAKKRCDMQRDEESKQEMRREAKKWVAKPKNKAYDELYDGLDTKGRREDIVPIGETETPSGKGCTTGQTDEG